MKRLLCDASCHDNTLRTKKQTKVCARLGGEGGVGWGGVPGGITAGDAGRGWELQYPCEAASILSQSPVALNPLKLHPNIGQNLFFIEQCTTKDK